MKYSTSTSMVKMFLHHAVGLKVDPQLVLKAAGIDADTLAKPNARISADRLNDLWQAAEIQAQDPHFGLHMAESMKLFPGGSLLLSIMVNSPTSREALEKFCRYHRITNDAIQPVLDIQAGRACLSLQVNGSETTLSRQVAEALVCILHSILKHLAGQDFRAVEVCFRHDRPDDITVHQRIFTAPLRFGQDRDGLVFRESVLDREVFLADPELLEALEDHARALLDRMDSTDTWTDKVTKLIHQNLQGEKPTLSRVARELAVSGRSLQNRLRDENTSFQTLLDLARKELAISYMKKKEISLAEIAFILGFSEQSAFNHAFKRWVGQTPTQYRRSPSFPH